MRYGTPYQKNGDETLGGTNTDRDIRTYRNKLDLPNLKGDLSVGFNTGKLKSLTTFSYRSRTDAYKLVGTKNEVRHYAAGELKKMTPKMVPVIGPGGNVVGMRPEMDPSTGMPVFVVRSTNLNDTTVIVPPDDRGLSVSGWLRHQREAAVRLRALRKVPVSNFPASYFSKHRYDFNGSILDENPLSNNSETVDLRILRGVQRQGADGALAQREQQGLPFFHPRRIFPPAGQPQRRNATQAEPHSYNMPRLLWTSQSRRVQPAHHRASRWSTNSCIST
ncbi:MAG: hypothetical protein ACLTZY_13680 [Alistipes indistinctus]